VRAILVCAHDVTVAVTVSGDCVLLQSEPSCTQYVARWTGPEGSTCSVAMHFTTKSGVTGVCEVVVTEHDACDDPSSGDIGIWDDASSVRCCASDDPKCLGGVVHLDDASTDAPSE
jgi:hypothetical protein